MNETICGQCKKEYKAKRKMQKYCSADCQRASRKGIPETRSCLSHTCANVFTVSVKSDPKKYCSRSCAASVNNTSSPKRKPEGSCKICNTPIPNSYVHCDEHMSKNLPKIPKPIVVIQDRTCAFCNNSFSPATHNQKFCAIKCLNDYHNRRHSQVCKNCNIAITVNSRSGYCTKCRIENVKNQRINDWLNGDWRGGTDLGLSETIRQYLLEKANYACSKCGFNTMHPVDGKPVIEVNHIDGDGGNHNPENLEVICPNCHSLTPNYRARNIGFGRKVYYLRREK